MNTSVNCSATAGAKYTSLVSFWTQSQLTLTILYLTNEFLQVLQAHEDVLYLAIAGYTAPPALLSHCQFGSRTALHNIMAVFLSTPVTS